MCDELEVVIQRIIETKELNPVIERRPSLGRALGISRQTQWRWESKLGIEPVFYVGESERFKAAAYLRAFLRRDLNEEGSR
jgi:hypothetical protein